MIKTFILIIITSTTHGLTYVNAEFDDEKSCIKAMETITSNTNTFVNYAGCFPKGDK